VVDLHSSYVNVVGRRRLLLLRGLRPHVAAVPALSGAGRGRPSRRWPPPLPAFEFFLALLSMIFLTFILHYMIFLTFILFLLIIIFVANVLRSLADRHLVCHMVLCPYRPTEPSRSTWRRDMFFCQWHSLRAPTS